MERTLVVPCVIKLKHCGVFNFLNIGHLFQDCRDSMKHYAWINSYWFQGKYELLARLIS